MNLVLSCKVQFDLEEVLSVALTAITAGKGFGMNRAFLLLTDREAGLLKGYLAIGPRNLEEASRPGTRFPRTTWICRHWLRIFVRTSFPPNVRNFTISWNSLTVPLSNKDHIVIKALDGKRPLLVEDAFHHPDVPPELARLLGVDTFLLMPLISRNRRVGMIIADNCITHRHITDEDMHSLETFQFPGRLCH